MIEREKAGGEVHVQVSEHPKYPRSAVDLWNSVLSHYKLSQDIFCIKLRMNQRRHRVESQPSLLCYNQPIVPLKRTSFNPDFLLGPESFQWLSKL